MIKRHLLGDDIVDQVHRVIGGGQRGNDGIPRGRVRLPLKLFIRNVGDEHDIDASVGPGLRIMPIVVHPSESAVLADDTVLGIIHLIFAGADLMHNGGADPVIVFRIHHSAECISGQIPEFFQAGAAIDAEHRLVGVNQLFRLIRPVNKKTTRHMSAYFLDNGQGILIELKRFASHA